MKLRLIIAALLVILPIMNAHAELQIDVSGAVRDPLPLAFRKWFITMIR